MGESPYCISGEWYLGLYEFLLATLPMTVPLAVYARAGDNTRSNMYAIDEF